MPKAVITLYGRDYTVACEEGEEDRLMQIAQLVDRKMRATAGKVGNTTEQRILLLTCLTLADELLDLESKSEQADAAEEEILVAAIGQLRSKVANLVGFAGSA